MKRLLQYGKSQIGENILLDFLIRPRLTKFQRGIEHYAIVEEDEGQPDLVAWKVYGAEWIWWIISKANSAANPFKDFEVGDMILIPSLFDIFSMVETERT